MLELTFVFQKDRKTDENIKSLSRSMTRPMTSSS